jgi:filamentous hemagglutinin family protein
MSRHPQSPFRAGARIALLFSPLAFSLASSFPALAAPQGGQVTSGQAAISRNGAVTNINQSSHKAAINWRGFSIAGHETVNFNQPSASAMTLNRVVGNERSVIDGALNANGKVFLLNANGVLFGQGASVNTAGLVASTLNLSDEDFNAGRYVFQGSGGGQIINLGRITVTDGGYVALLGEQVRNEGVIIAQRGTVSLNGATKATLNFNGDSLVSVSLDEGALNALVENKQAIIADGGKVILTARAADELVASKVNTDGIVQARTLGDLTGHIELYAHGGTANVDGTLDASAPNGGDGGFIETSGNKVNIADGAQITTWAAQGKTGTWLIDPYDYIIAASGGDMTGARLGERLASNSITIQSALGGSEGQGDIRVNDAVAWSADTTLTLEAVNDIHIDNAIDVNGAGQLVLNHDSDRDGQGEYHILSKASFAGVDVVEPTEGTPGAGLSTPREDDRDEKIYGSINFTGTGGKLFIQGDEYILIRSLADLQAINTDANSLAGKYALAGNLDLSNAGVFTQALVGPSTAVSGASVVNAFTGTFAGLGHTIRDLQMNVTANNMGLFGLIYNAEIRDLGLIDATIASTSSGAMYTGALVGQAYGGNIHHVYSENGTVNGVNYVGGLVGGTRQRADGIAIRIDHAYVQGGTVTGVVQVGGLAGSAFSNPNSITHSHAAGGTITGARILGGLAGDYLGSVLDSWADMEVSGFLSLGWTPAAIGGLVGNLRNHASDISVRNSFALGNVTGLSNVGGLVGGVALNVSVSPVVFYNVYATGTVFVGTGGNGADASEGGIGGLIGGASNVDITYAHATGNVAQPLRDADGRIPEDCLTPGRLGGLLGQLTGKLSYAYATGNVSSPEANLNLSVTVGGLVGSAGSHRTLVNEISHSYALGDVAGATQVGGLVGAFGSPATGGLVSVISDSYAGGAIYSKRESGAAGLIAANSNPSGTVENSYWNADVSGYDNWQVITPGGEAQGSATGLTGVDRNDAEIVDAIVKGGDPATVITARAEAAAAAEEAARQAAEEAARQAAEEAARQAAEEAARQAAEEAARQAAEEAARLAAEEAARQAAEEAARLATAEAAARLAGIAAVDAVAERQRENAAVPAPVAAMPFVPPSLDAAIVDFSTPGRAAGSRGGAYSVGIRTVVSGGVTYLVDSDEE